jgi:acetyl-CoA carboxylase carboxyl transferase subunit alpha
MGGAHRNPPEIMQNLSAAIKDELAKLKKKSIKSLLVDRYERLMSYGKFKEIAEKS